ncbi:MAG: methyl-accepting chemotaxis protein [Cyanophyceae cyanobacterium]
MTVSRFSNLKLKYRIFIGYLVPILLTVALASFVSVYARRVQSNEEELKKQYDVFKGTAELAFDIATLQKTARGYLLKKNNRSFSEYSRRKQSFEQLSQAVAETIDDEELQTKFDRIAELGRQTISYNDRLIALVNQNQVEQAISIWRQGKGLDITDELDQRLRDLKAEEIQLINTVEAAQEAAINSLNTVVLFLSVLSCALMLGIGLLLASAISREVNQSIAQIAASSSEIAATTQQQERINTEQATSVSQTTTTMAELGTATRQTTAQAEASASGARQALELAEEGNKAVEKTVAGINTLKNQVSSIAEQITHLSERTGQISLVTELVSNVANQTNMLALNASVEAARAGEGGKGFSVVAGEIRKLADQSKKSSETINNLVRDIQAALNSTVMVTDQGTKKADEGIRLASSSAQSFAEVAAAINDVFLNSQQIAITTKPQAVAVQQVVSAMNELNSGAQESASGANQVQSSIEQLNKAAQRLKERTV